MSSYEHNNRNQVSQYKVFDENAPRFEINHTLEIRGNLENEIAGEINYKNGNWVVNPWQSNKRRTAWCLCHWKDFNVKYEKYGNQFATSNWNLQERSIPPVRVMETQHPYSGNEQEQKWKSTWYSIHSYSGLDLQVHKLYSMSNSLRIPLYKFEVDCLSLNFWEFQKTVRLLQAPLHSAAVYLTSCSINLNVHLQLQVQTVHPQPWRQRISIRESGQDNRYTSKFSVSQQCHTILIKLIWYQYDVL